MKETKKNITVALALALLLLGLGVAIGVSAGSSDGVSDYGALLYSETALAIILLVALVKVVINLLGRIKKAEEKIDELNTKDILTDIYNRRYVMSRFDIELARSRRLKRDLSCIIIDIHNFRWVNEKYGFSIGDEVLKEIAFQIKTTLRKYDIPGRYGGEEFIVVTPDISPSDATALAGRIKTKLEETVVKAIKVRVHLGMSSFMDSDETIDTIIKRAEDCLYKSKKGEDVCS